VIFTCDLFQCGVIRPFCGKFVHGLAGIFFTWHISITHVAAWKFAHVKFGFSGKDLGLVIIYETHDGTIDLLCFPWQPQSGQWLQCKALMFL